MLKPTREGRRSFENGIQERELSRNGGIESNLDVLRKSSQKDRKQDTELDEEKGEGPSMGEQESTVEKATLS